MCRGATLPSGTGRLADSLFASGDELAGCVALWAPSPAGEGGQPRGGPEPGWVFRRLAGSEHASAVLDVRADPLSGQGSLAAVGLLASVSADSYSIYTRQKTM